MWKPWSKKSLSWREDSPKKAAEPRRSRRSSSSRASHASAVAYTGDCWLERLPDDLLENLIGLLDHPSLHALEEASRFCANTLKENGYWKSSIDDRLVCYEDPAADARTKAALWKKMHCMKEKRAGFTSDSLLTGVVGCDSPNDFSVPPTWLLFKSRCWFWMEKLLNKSPERDTASLYVRQLHCGCGYHVPCFWASGGSSSPDAVASIDFSVRPHSFLSHIHFVPYQAYWLENHPAFAPKQVSFTLLHQVGGKSTCFYESPVYSVKNEMTLQQFDLPKTVWTTPGCVLRVNLIGRTQRAPMEERPWIPVRKPGNEEPGTEEEPEYFCCLSYINATGFVIRDEAAKKSRRWWHH